MDEIQLDRIKIKYYNEFFDNNKELYKKDL